MPCSRCGKRRGRVVYTPTTVINGQVPRSAPNQNNSEKLKEAISTLKYVPSNGK